MPEGKESPGPDRIARERIRILREHANAVLEVRERAKRAFEELLAREVELLVFDGFSPRLAEQAARNNLALRTKAIEAELHDMLALYQDALRRRMQRLAEDVEDGLYGADDAG
ncbi:MAG TPA: hypothetical protein VKA46_40930 [Gemmataceae bacterium]|nr:hypothetical protein [Gemmataceae bacterium]